VTFWENLWRGVAEEMPALPSRKRSWAGFLAALVTALLLAAIWFPIRLIHEILKAINLSEKPDHTAEARRLYAEASELARALPSKSEFAKAALRGVDLPPPLHDFLFEAFRDLYAANMMLEPPPVPSKLDDLGGIRWRDRLRREIDRMRSGAVARMTAACTEAAKACASAVPHIADESEITAPLSSLTNPGRLVEAFVRPLNSDLFPAFAERYLDNTYRVSGVPRGKYAKPPKLDEPRHLDDPSPFLEATPFSGLLATPLPVALPQAARFSHHWIVAPTGGGKTTALSFLIAQDIERAVRGECSLVILDSQRQLIQELASLKVFAPGQPLDGKLCVLDAADIEYPIAINLFDLGLDRLGLLSPLDREKITNSALEMYEFIIGSLLQAEMTSRQSTLFRYVTRAMFALPGSTILTFQDILKNGLTKYQADIGRLEPGVREFFATDFNSNATFKQTREQVNARLLAVLDNGPFRNMFSSPRSKIDFFEQINTPGSVILINAEKALLKDEGTELFGRFFLGLINQAAAQRSVIPPDKRLPCFVYVDECHNYIKSDPKIQVILSEARQQRVALILAHQFLNQIDPPVRAALAANTAIKMVAKLDSGDRVAMARDMNTVPDFIRDQPIGSFAVFIRDPRPVTLSMGFPEKPLARFKHMRADEETIVRDRMRERYARYVPYDAKDPEASRNEAQSPPPTDPPPSRPSKRRRDPDGP
jgi:hypothetical protein